MSIALMTEVWRLDIPTTDKMVLLALADWSNEEGACWPSMAQLAKKSGLTDRAIRAAVGRLVSMGHLTRHEVAGKGVHYTVHPGTTFRPARGSPRNEVPNTPERPSANTSGTTKPTSEAKASSVVRVTPAKPKRTKSVPSKRCPDSWMPSPGDLEVGEGKGLSPGEISEELAKFRDHTFGTARSDWSATFRNWLREAARRTKPRAHHGKPDKLASRHENYAASYAGADLAADLLASRRAL